MPSYLVTGAGRGLGYAFLQVLAADPENTVIGLTRDAEAARARLAGDGLSHVHVVQGAPTDAASLNQAVKEVETILGDKGLDVLINNAAYISEVTAWKSTAQFEDNQEFFIDDINKSFQTNTVGALRVILTFIPLIKKGTVKKVLNISSGMGDIAFINETKIPVATPYAISKAGLSLLNAKLDAAYHDQGILFMALCPGYVATSEKEPTQEQIDGMEAMGVLAAPYAPDFKGLMTPAESAVSCLAAINRSSLEGGHGGSFLSHNGTKRWM